MLSSAALAVCHAASLRCFCDVDELDTSISRLVLGFQAKTVVGHSCAADLMSLIPQTRGSGLD